MTIEKTNRHKKHREIRKWAERHKEEIFEKLGKKCNKCGTTEDLTIHHKQYETGIENLEILCNKHHREFHKLETKKRLLTIFLGDVCSFKGSLEDYKKSLKERINKIPVDLIKGIKIDGL